MSEAVETAPQPPTSRELQSPGAEGKGGLRKGEAGAGGRLFGWLALLALLLGVGYGVWRHIQTASDARESAEKRRDFAPQLRVAPVKRAGAVLPVTLPATIEAFESANINARATGYIEKRYVDIGSRVKAGQRLVDITAPELEDQLRQAQAALSQAEAAARQASASRELARVTNARTSVLAKQGWVTRQRGDNDRLNLEAQQNATQAAQANVETQRSQAKAIQQRRSYLQVTAPFDGVITQRNVDVGTLVQSDVSNGTFMFQLMRDNVLRIQTYVPQDQAFGVTPGVKAIIRVPEIPGREFKGEVTRVAEALAPLTRTLQTEVDVPNPDGALLPGAYCLVELQVPRRTPTLLVPAQAIIFNEGGLHVAVVKDDVVHMRPIRIARDLGKEVEIYAGLEEGDQLALSPPVNLVDGQKVGVAPTPDEKKPGEAGSAPK